MQNFLFLTDTHIDYFSLKKLNAYIKQIKSLNIDGIWSAGDVANGKIGLQYLQYLQSGTGKPIYFINGNHDYYGETIVNHRERCQNFGNIKVKYLNYIDFIEIDSKNILLGDDGWYDGGWGDDHYLLLTSLDFFKIKDFKLFSSSQEKLELIRKLAQGSADRLVDKLIKAFESHDIAHLITHVPPWAETDRTDYLDRLWIPYNSCKIMTLALEKLMKQYPNKKLKIYSGHTHRERHLTKGNIDLFVADARMGTMNLENIISI